MYVKRRVALPTFGMVCHAIKAAFQGTVTLVLDKVPGRKGDGVGSDPMVHADAERQLSDYYREGFEAGGGRCGRGGRVYHVGASGIAEPCRLINRQRAAIILPAPGGKAVKRRANATGNRRTGGRRVRRSSAIRTSKRETIYLDGRCLWCGGTADVPNRDLCAGCTMHFNDISAETRKLDKRRTDWLGGGKSQ